MTGYAYVAATYIRADCKQRFKDSDRMESTWCQGAHLDCFDIVGTGSHKYVPTEKLNKDLGLPDGAGVYGYAKFSDGSYLLFTCDGRVACWSGKEEDQAKYPKDPTHLS